MTSFNNELNNLPQILKEIELKEIYIHNRILLPNIG